MMMMKKFYYFSLLLGFLLSPLTLFAQHTPQEVLEPGAKGELPALPEIAAARSGELDILMLTSVYFDFGYSGSNEAWLSFGATPKELGATSFTLQYRSHDGGSWSNKMEPYSENTSMDDVVMPYAQTDFRLLVNGGEYDGFISNVVTAKIGTGPHTSCSGWSESEQMFKMVGYPIGSTFGFGITVNVSGTMTDYDQSAGFYRYQWYRQNPNNGDYKPIEGATEATYTPVLDDCGSNMLLEVYGDGTNCNFTLCHNFGMVYLPVQASLSYIGTDGFVMNTDYVIPNAATAFVNYDQYYGTMDDFVPVSGVSERQPGQYVFRLSKDQYDGYEFDLKEDGYKLTFVYMQDWLEIPEPWYREAQVMADRYVAPMTVKAMFSGRPVPTDINVWGRNIDNELVKVATAYQETSNFDGVSFDDLYTIGSGYVLEALGTPSTATTYYPAALSMDAATAVYPGYDEEWNPVVFTIDVQQSTGINDVKGEATAYTRYYDLQGRQVAQPTKGLYIVNGRKMIK